MNGFSEINTELPQAVDAEKIAVLDTAAESRALFRAVRDNDAEALRRMESEGASLHHRHQLGYSLLTYAVVCGHEDTIRTLVDLGMDVDSEDGDGHTALVWAAGSGSNGTPQLVELLLELGADINHLSGKGGMTALRCAAINGHDDIVKALIGKGADQAIKGKDGKTAEDMAIQAGRTNVIAVFEKIRHNQRVTRINLLKRKAPKKTQTLLKIK